ncbi:MAG TPA: GNAT family N-acetyltransferase, partial [Candidatus Acidoferrum sp.]|nr:GNAT family N-acetyltransferase [Candidatus Acidoferrum sp.]
MTQPDPFLREGFGQSLKFFEAVMVLDKHRVSSWCDSDAQSILPNRHNPWNRSARIFRTWYEKSGVTVAEASDEDFAEEYYDQLKDVFGKQGLVPTYDLARVRQLIKHLRPTGRLLLLRARNAEGRCIATNIYVGMNRLSHSWGSASYRKDQGDSPNEALRWYALRYWKSRGMRWHDWGGGGEYKQKYGGTPIAVPWFFKS